MVLACSAVERGDQVAVGGAGCGESVVAVLEVLATVEELLFEFGDVFPEGAGFVGAGEAGVVEDLFAEDFGQPLGEFGVLVAQAFVVFTEVGEVGQQRPSADVGAGRVRFGFGGQGEDLGAQVVVAIQKRAIDPGGASDRRDGDLVAVGAESVEGIEDFPATAIAVVAPRRDQRVSWVLLSRWVFQVRVECRRAGGGQAQVHSLAGGAHDPDGFRDLSAVVLVERVQVVFDAADQLSQPGDFGVGGHRLGAGPVVEFGGGPDPFAVTQQRVEVVPQLRQVRRIGAEVPAAQASESERAGPTGPRTAGNPGPTLTASGSLGVCLSQVTNAPIRSAAVRQSRSDRSHHRRYGVNDSA